MAVLSVTTLLLGLTPGVTPRLASVRFSLYPRATPATSLKSTIRAALKDLPALGVAMSSDSVSTSLLGEESRLFEATRIAFGRACATEGRPHVSMQCTFTLGGAATLGHDGEEEASITNCWNSRGKNGGKNGRALIPERTIFAEMPNLDVRDVPERPPSTMSLLLPPPPEAPPSKREVMRRTASALNQLPNLLVAKLTGASAGKLARLLTARSRKEETVEGAGQSQGGEQKQEGGQNTGDQQEDGREESGGEGQSDQIDEAEIATDEIGEVVGDPIDEDSEKGLIPIEAKKSRILLQFPRHMPRLPFFPHAHITQICARFPHMPHFPFIPLYIFLIPFEASRLMSHLPFSPI